MSESSTSSPLAARDTASPPILLGHRDGGTTPADAGMQPECSPGQTASCKTDCGSTGTLYCSGELGWAESCAAPAEACANATDDDCDGLVDSADPSCWSCTPGATRACTTVCGSAGTQSCGGNGQWDPACPPPSEVCGNGTDDDCNALVDSADPSCWVCTPGATRACTSACGSVGTHSCGGNGQWDPTCPPPSEVCGNGTDDDCDGLVDSADPSCWVCTPGTIRYCTSTCGSTGTQACGVGQWNPTCTPPTETCTNGVDDDCDGKVDGSDPDCPPTVYTCESAEGGGCNNDMGWGDRCDPSENTAGCSAGRFWAWCNRRNPSYPDIWDNWVHDWVSNRCDGQTTGDGTQYNTFSCLSSGNNLYKCTTPLVLAFDGAPVRFASSSQSFNFTPGEPVLSDWPTAVTPWLVRDLNQNGRIDDGRELFGSNTLLASGSTAMNGFEALAELDSNHDGVVDAKDAAFETLKLWSDSNADKRSQPGELVSLTQRGVQALSVTYSVEARCDGRGNCERERAGFHWTDSRGSSHQGAVIDVWLKTGTASNPERIVPMMATWPSPPGSRCGST